MFTAELEGLEDVRKAFRYIESHVHDAVREAADAGAAHARAVHQYKDRTGELTRKTTSEMLSSDSLGNAEAEIVADTPYARYVEGGTRPHEIKAGGAKFFSQRGGAKALRWEDSSGVHFAKRVWHPGTKPLPFMGPAYIKAQQVLEAALQRIVAKAQELLDR